MRTIVRANNPVDCQRRVTIKEREGWKAITNVKLDTSGDYDSYVCVMEKSDEPHEKKHKWNNRFPI
jgi:hypothetical protein